MRCAGSILDECGENVTKRRSSIRVEYYLVAQISHVSERPIQSTYNCIWCIVLPSVLSSLSHPLPFRRMILIHTLLLIVDPNKSAAELGSLTGKVITTDKSENQRVKYWVVTAGGFGS